MGTALGLCLTLTTSAQEAPLAVPPSIVYPGMLQTFEKLIEIDNTKFKNRSSALIKNNRIFTSTTTVTNLDLDPDFLNSVILHSDAGYIKLASTDKCRFYDTILTDLLKSAEGKITNVMVAYLNSKSEREFALMNRRDFLNLVVSKECPQTAKMIELFQIKNLDRVLKETEFDLPSGQEQCHNIHLSWLNNPKTPYLCQIHEYIQDANKGLGDPKDLTNRRSVAKLLEKKLSPVQKEYLRSLCTHLDDEAPFCEEFLNVSFWNKVASGIENPIYAENICKKVLNVQTLTSNQLKECLIRMRKENDLCLYEQSPALSPKMDCEALSVALNHSKFRSDYQDCPAYSDSHIITNVSRIILNAQKTPLKPYAGTCATPSTGEFLAFNRNFDNDEIWKTEACYYDRANDREVCRKTFFGSYDNDPASYTNVVADVMRELRGADRSLKCQMVSSAVYNPSLLEFKSGCHIVYEEDQCFLSRCKHKLVLNDRPVDLIKIKGELAFDYFPSSLQNERSSQNYLLTKDFKLQGKALNNLTNLKAFFRKSTKGIIHGIGCLEELVPSFFKVRAINQCTPQPFIIDGIINDGSNVSLVTRLSIDNLQGPRIIDWSHIFSAVKSYQRQNPLKTWTLYGLD